MDPAVVLHLLGTLAALSCSKFEKGVEARLLQQRALDVLAFSAKAMLKIRDGPSRPIILAHTLGARTLLNLTTCFNERTTYDQAIECWIGHESFMERHEQHKTRGGNCAKKKNHADQIMMRACHTRTKS